MSETYAALEIGELPESLPHIAVEEAWAIDVDRTLSSVDAVLKRLTTIGEIYGVPADAVITAHSEASKSENNAFFDPLKFYREQLSEREYTALCEKFPAAGQDPITYADTPAFLGRITSPHLILTYAKQAPFQRIKLRSLPFKGYAHILDHTDKGPVIESWRSPKGTFDFLGISVDGKPIAIYNAQRVNLIDDDGRSHQQLPPESKGYYIRRPLERTRKAALDPLPENVTLIRSLDEIAEFGKTQDAHEPPEKPHAYIPLSETDRPVVRLGQSILSSVGDNELDSLRA